MSFNAKQFDKIYPDREREIDFLLEHLKGKTVLDIGGGTGAISEILYRRLGFICTIIEPQKEMCEFSKSRGMNYTICSTIEDLKIEDFKIDIKFDNAIMVFDVFNFLDEPWKALNNIAKILKKKGRLIFSYWNEEIKKSGWEFNWKLLRLSRKKWCGDLAEIDFWFPFFHEKHTLVVYSDRTIADLLKKTGFKIIEKLKNKFTTTIIAEICV